MKISKATLAVPLMDTTILSILSASTCLGIRQTRTPQSLQPSLLSNCGACHHNGAYHAQDKYHLYQILSDGFDTIQDGVRTRVGDGDGAFYSNHRDGFRAVWARDVNCARVRPGGDNGGIAVRNRKSA